MLIGLDHVVIAVPDPDAAAAELEDELGIAWNGGGRHAGAGTVNRLAWLADGSYLELIGVEDAALAARHPIGAAALRTLTVDPAGGLATWAIAADEPLDDLVAGLRAAGSKLNPPTDGSRVRPDGETVRWSIAAPDVLSATTPFLIYHEPTGTEWGPGALDARRVTAHPIGAPLRLVSLELPAADPVEAAAAVAREVGLMAATSLRIGPHAVVFDRGAQEPRITLAATLPVTTRTANRDHVRWTITGPR